MLRWLRKRRLAKLLVKRAGIVAERASEDRIERATGCVYPSIRAHIEREFAEVNEAIRQLGTQLSVPSQGT